MPLDYKLCSTDSGRIMNDKQHFKQTVEPPDSLILQLSFFDGLFGFESSDKVKKNELLYRILKKYFPVKNIDETVILDFVNYEVEQPKYSPKECVDIGISYATPLTIKFRLKITNGEIVDQDVYFGEIPYMTPFGSFVYHGIERVCVTKIQKSIGISFFSNNKQHDVTDYICKIIPSNGVWIDITVNAKKIMYISFNKNIKVLLSNYLKILGLKTEKDIFDIVGIVEEITCTRENLENIIGKEIASRVQIKNIVNCKNGPKETLKTVFNIRTVITKKNIDEILQTGIKKILYFKCTKEELWKYEPLINTVVMMSTKSTEELAIEIYKLFNKGYSGKDSGMALKYLTDIITDERIFDIGDVGRRKINSIVGFAEEDEFKTVLSVNDLKNIIRHFLDIINGQKEVEDIDNYGNKCLVNTYDQFFEEINNAFYRISKIAKERLNISDRVGYNIYNLINCGIFSSVINQFFATNSFMQFMDGLNPLSEVMQKRRISTIGVGGITAESKSTEIRDIHYSQYGKICPIETPEGINIGLIYALALYAKYDKNGLIITPYRKVNNGVIDLDNNHIIYMDANSDIYCNIAPANVNYDEDGNIIDDFVKVRYFDTFKSVSKYDVDYVDISTNQAFSISASLIPFLENDDSSRALLGANMQRQALPLLKPQAPIVGTGLEQKVCKDSRDILYAEHDGVIEYVDSATIVIKYDLTKDEKMFSFDEEVKTYHLTKVKRTNQKTCMNINPIVNVGDRVKKGDVLVDGFATDKGELALGVNLKVAFMTYNGYNYEDAIVISERVLKEDLLTSIYIDDYEIERKKTKICDEEFTNDLSDMNDNDIVNLGDDGIVKIGAHVKSGDILVGKVKPKTNANVTPETKLLKEIFSERAYDMCDSSLIMPPFLQGVVIDSKVYEKNDLSSNRSNKVMHEIEKLKEKYTKELEDFKEVAIKKFTELLKGEKSNMILEEYGEVIMLDGEIFDEDTIRSRFFNKVEYDIQDFIVLKYKLSIENILSDNWTKNSKKNILVEELIKKTIYKINYIRNEFYKEFYKEKYGDQIDPGILAKAKVTVACKRKLQVGDKLSGRHGNKGVVSKICRIEDMPFLEDGTPVDLVLTPLGVPSRMNLGQIYETLLGWAGEKLGCKYATPVFAGYDLESINKELEKANLPLFGETQLYDGLTGEKFDQKCTVGNIYFLKLNHMVNDKVHARSIGKYSMVSQQPLSGRSNEGGQRLGEMEVWALEAYGAAYTLQEMLTIKSDDIIGRRKAFESIIRGNDVPECGKTESFNVLIQELIGIGLSISFNTDPLISDSVS